MFFNFNPHNKLEMNNTNKEGWLHKKSEIFWAEIPPCEHLIQIYENDEVFINSLVSFATAGIAAGEVTIIIATGGHIQVLEERMMKKGIDITAAKKSDLYIPLDAGETIKTFMVNSWPDEEKFNKLIIDLIARGNGRRIRAFGEMVALMWAQGFNGATIHLEHLWGKFCDSGVFCLFCAYPKSGFTQDIKTSINDVCQKHSTVIAGWEDDKDAEVFYKTGTF